SYKNFPVNLWLSYSLVNPGLTTVITEPPLEIRTTFHQSFKFVFLALFNRQEKKMNQQLAHHSQFEPNSVCISLTGL
ncbi:unnamed protein product, partial [Allacma fusca]